MPHTTVTTVEIKHARVWPLFRVRRAINRNIEHLEAQMAAMYKIDAAHRLCCRERERQHRSADTRYGFMTRMGLLYL
jgi:hypothetical protein